MLLGDDVEDLRRTLGGGRGSIRQPFTLMEEDKGKRKSERDEQGNSSSQNRFIESDRSLKEKSVCRIVPAHRPGSVCFGLELEGGDKGMQTQEVCVCTCTQTHTHRDRSSA